MLISCIDWLRLLDDVLLDIAIRSTELMDCPCQLGQVAILVDGSPALTGSGCGLAVHGPGGKGEAIGLCTCRTALGPENHGTSSSEASHGCGRTVGVDDTATRFGYAGGGVI